MTPRLTLLTDFGTRDGYVGAMKGVIASISPGVALDDISHAVEPGDVRGASLALERYWDRYPSGTVHLVVVDPGVGTERKALAVEADRRLLVLPDNGVVTRVIDSADRWRAVSLEREEFWADHPSSTFHGRDLFAPVAARLAAGLALERLGPSVRDPVRLPPLPAPLATGDGAIEGRVIGIDRFGNLSTNLPAEELGGWEWVEVAGRRIPRAETYGRVGPGELLTLVSSDGRVEVAVRGGSAAQALSAAVGTPVRVLSDRSRASPGPRR
jgi:S-adenosyl-L-methionine hydrolase (adenosine-forming)